MRWREVSIAIGLMCGCTDKAIIAALCPPDCVPRAQGSVCDCNGAGPQGGSPAAVDAGALTDAARDAAVQCGSGTITLAHKHQDLLVVVDDDTTLGFWWPALSAGFDAFIQEEASRGLGVGLMRFGTACESQAYSADVPIEPLPGNLSALQQAFPATAGQVNSTLPGLAAALQLAQRWANDHPQSRTNLLLITDASPGACDGASPGEATRIVGVAYAASPSVATYVVGGGGLMLVDAIASAGGTKAQTIAPLGTADDVLSALHAVRSDLFGCALALPQGQTLAPDSRVLATAADGTQRSFAIERGSAGCQQGGFYMTDETAPYPLVACPDTCANLDGARLSLSSACSARP